MRCLVLALLFPAQVLACGACVEDKIASTYDHALIQKTLARQHHVVFFHVDGALSAETGHWLKSVAAATRGVDQGSARVAVETLTLSVAYDPKRISLVDLQAALEKKMAARNLSLLLLRELDHR